MAETSIAPPAGFVLDSDSRAPTGNLPNGFVFDRDERPPSLPDGFVMDEPRTGLSAPKATQRNPLDSARHVWDLANSEVFSSEGTPGGDWLRSPATSYGQSFGKPLANLLNTMGNTPLGLVTSALAPLKAIEVPMQVGAGLLGAGMVAEGAKKMWNAPTGPERLQGGVESALGLLGLKAAQGARVRAGKPVAVSAKPPKASAKIQEPTFQSIPTPDEVRAGIVDGIPEDVPRAEPSANAPQTPIMPEPALPAATKPSEPSAPPVEWKHEDLPDFLPQTKEPLLKRDGESGAISLPAPPKPVVDAVAHVGAIIDEARTLPDVTDMRRAVSTWDAAHQRATFSGRKLIDYGNAKFAPDRQRAMEVWMEAGGDHSVIDAQMSKVPTKYKKAWLDAKTLSPDEIAAAQSLRNHYNAWGDVLTKEGILSDVIDDYAGRHIWKKWSPELGKLMADIRYGKLKTNFDSARQRIFQTLADGIIAGKHPANMNAFDLAGLYHEAATKVLADRAFVKRLTKAKVKVKNEMTGAVEEQPAAITGGITSIVPDATSADAILTRVSPSSHDGMNFKPIGHPALRNWKWTNEIDGKPVMVNGDLWLNTAQPARGGISPYQHVKNVLGRSEIQNWYESGGGAMARTAKGALKFVDTALSNAKAAMFSFSGFHIVQEGTHAVGHTVNPFTLTEFNPSNPMHARAIESGTKLFTDQSNAAHIIDGLGSNAWVHKMPAIGKLARAVTDFTFQRYIPALKLDTFDHIYTRNMDRFAGDIKSGKVTAEQVAHLSSEQTNAAYGHLNYALMGRNPTFQHLLRLFAVAPDFLEARGRFAAQAIKGFGSKSGREQLRAIGILAGSMWLASRVMNGLANNGDLKFDKPFSVIVGNREYAMRSVPADIWHLFSDPMRFTANRLAPGVRQAMEHLTGRDYRGVPVSQLEALRDTLTVGLPISLRGSKEINLIENALGSVGIHVRRYSPDFDVHKMAEAYRAKNNIPEDKNVYAPSKFIPIKQALQDGNIDEARKRLDELVTPTAPRPKVVAGLLKSLSRGVMQSPVDEYKFVKSLSTKELETYNNARQQRLMMRKNLLQMLQSKPEALPDDAGTPMPSMFHSPMSPLNVPMMPLPTGR